MMLVLFLGVVGLQKIVAILMTKVVRIIKRGVTKSANQFWSRDARDFAIPYNDWLPVFRVWNCVHAVEKKLDDIFVAFRCGQMKGRSAIVVALVDVDALDNVAEAMQKLCGNEKPTP